MANALADLASH
ncbi:hypothetical protein U9M48_019506 [Paspalum notatum var. saurae]|uniref:Uncharacterized protein n=1 Tax=Paspalum notatum var. saurae TaxID=547442 RepID=A0AAQ3TDB0_PASNO